MVTSSRGNSGPPRLLLALGAAGVVLVIIAGFWMLGRSGGGGGKGGAARDQRVGFEMGKVNPSAPIESIKVTLAVGAKGADLTGPVDLHLGVGFPLRLDPRGGVERAPAFAAYPQKSSLDGGEKMIKAGSSATFEFSAKAADKGDDVLATTPHLLRDLTVGDIQRLGFSSQAKTNWVLAGYRVEVNGELLAANDSVEVRAVEQLSRIRENLQKALPQQEALARQAGDLQAYVATGLGGEADKVELARKNAELARAAEPIAELLGQTAGYLPWYVDPAFKPAPLPGTPVTALRVTLATGGGERPGTRNPLYLWAAGRKYLLASEADPLADEPEPQHFRIAPADLAVSPLTREKLDVIGIGMIGNDQKFSAVPDRARVQRVVLETGGKTIYDSELKPGDRRTLAAIWLVPPAHRDDGGRVVENAASPSDLYLWKSGTAGPVRAAETAPLPPPRLEPPPPLRAATAEPLLWTLPSTVPTNPIPPPSVSIPSTLPPPPTVRTPQSRPPTVNINITIPPPLAPSSVVPQGWPPLGALGSAPIAPPIRSVATNTAGLPQIPRVFFPPTGAATPAPAVAGLPATPAPAGAAAAIVPPGPVAPPAPVLTPVAPAVAPVPVVSNVAINPVTPIVCDGDSPVVQFTVTGNTSQVASYRIDLFAVLPHKSPALINTPVASPVIFAPPLAAGGGGGSQTFQQQAGKIALNLTAFASQLTGAEAQYLYIQPKVTVFGVNGQALGGGGVFGSLLPVFPAGTLAANVSLARGGFASGVGQTPAGWHDTNAGTPWVALGTGDAGAANGGWALQAETASQSALTFATHENLWPPTPPPPFPVFNTATRSTAGSGTPETIVLKFEGFVPIPSAPFNGLRAVAHVGFVGAADPAATVTVLSRAELSTGPIPRDLTDQVYTGLNPFFMLQSDGNVTMTFPAPAAAAPPPLLLVDIPIRFDRMAANNTAGPPAYPLDPVNPTAYGAVTFNQPAFAAAGPGPVYVTLTYMLTLTSPNAKDAVGLFGVRLVPDNTP